VESSEARPDGLFELLKFQNAPYVITWTSGRDSFHVGIGFDNHAAAGRGTDHTAQHRAARNVRREIRCMMARAYANPNGSD